MTRPTTSVKVAAITKFGRPRSGSRRDSRSPTAANMPPEARPSSVGLMPPTMPPGLVDMMTTPAVATRIAIIIGQRHHIAEEDQAEDRDLDRLGLDIGDGDDERALAHRQRASARSRRSAQRRRRSTQGQNVHAGCGSGAPVHSTTTGEKDAARTESRTGNGHGSRPRCRGCRSARAAWHCARSGRAAAMTVKTTQSQGSVVTRASRRLSPRRPCN